jgi:uncharacterized membrane protein (DUF4010 family)
MGGDYLQTLERLGVALALGLLIGMERGWERRDMPEGSRVAGFRTFGIITLLGAVTTLLSPDSMLPFTAAFVVLGMAMALGYWRESSRWADISLTTTITALLALGLGALAGKGEFVVATSTAVVVTLLLGFKPELHHLLQRIEREELLATLRLLLISVVILPILPDRGFGPWQAVNPYRLWWLVVLVAALSYAGYFGIKLLGRERGVLVSSVLGGLVSSTAVTLNLSRLARDKPRQQVLLASGVTIASATMFPRILVMAAVVAPELVISLAFPLIAAAVISFALGAWQVWRIDDRAIDTDGQLEPRNPLSLQFAIEFGALLALIMLMAHGFGAWLGGGGLLAVGAISGLADVDAITVSTASMFHTGHAALAPAVGAILIAAAVNTVVKAGLTAAIGGLRMGLCVTLPLLAALAAGAAAWWLF